MKEKAPTPARVSIRRHILLGIAIVVLLGGGVGGWASTAQISGALIAQGSLVVDSNVKKVQHPTGGVVGEVRVRDGDHVKAGDIVVRLDETVTRANLAIVTKGLTELYARKARLAAERDGADQVNMPKELADRSSDPDVAEALNSERKLFDLRRKARTGQKDQLRQRISQLKEEIIGLTAQQDAKTKEIGFINTELSGVRDLYKKALVPLTRLTALEREATRLDGERGQLVAQTAQAKGKIAETELQILQIDQDMSSDVAKELREIDGKVGEFVERKVTAEDQLKRIDIRAPQDGVVFQSNVHTVGGVITAGDAIMLIVPEVRQSSGRGQGRSQGHRSVVARPESRAALLRLQPAHDARAQRHRLTYRRRHHQRSAHWTNLLHRPRFYDAGRDQASRRRQAHPWHAGRNLHPDRRTHDARLPDQAAARPIDAFVPREIKSVFLPHERGRVTALPAGWWKGRRRGAVIICAARPLHRAPQGRIR